MRWALAVVLALSSACALWSSQPPPAPCEELPIELFIQGGKVLNVNPEGQSLPVELRVFFLAQRDKFDAQDFDSLWKKPEEALDKTALKSTALTIFPGEDKIEALNVPIKTAYIAFAGIFRQVDGDQWKKVVDVRRLAERCKAGDLHFQVRAGVEDNRVIAQERVE